MKIGRLNRASFAKIARRAMLLFAFAALGTQAAMVAKVGDVGYEALETAILADQQYDIDVSFKNLKLSKPNPKDGGDYGHSTNYFTMWLRNTGAAENTVTYENCTFPNEACNNQYGKTVYTTWREIVYDGTKWIEGIQKVDGSGTVTFEKNENPILKGGYAVWYMRAGKTEFDLKLPL